MTGRVAAFASGALFAIGLVLGGMTQPAKVVAFLDIFGDWDPSLAFVMAGAIAVYLPVYRWVGRLERPVAEAAFILPTATAIDRRLIVGAVLFGVGWGLGGFCPGPAFTSLGTLSTSTLVFVAAMVAGFVAVEAWNRRRG